MSYEKNWSYTNFKASFNNITNDKNVEVHYSSLFGNFYLWNDRIVQEKWLLRLKVQIFSQYINIVKNVTQDKVILVTIVWITIESWMCEHYCYLDVANNAVHTWLCIYKCLHCTNIRQLQTRWIFRGFL